MEKFWKIIDKGVLIIMHFILKIFHIRWEDEQWTSLLQFVRFAIVGISNTVLSYVINIIVLFIMNPLNVSWDYFAGNIVAFLLSVLWSFYWNNKYVFKKAEGEKRNLWKVLIKTYASYAISGIVLANFLSWIWVSVLGISKYVAPLINLLISVPMNFILNKLWAYKSE